MASDDYRECEQHCRHRRPAHSRAAFLQGLELFWQVWIADYIPVKVRDCHTHSVFYFACPKIMQQRAPVFVFF